MRCVSGLRLDRVVRVSVRVRVRVSVRVRVRVRVRKMQCLTTMRLP